MPCANSSSRPPRVFACSAAILVWARGGKFELTAYTVFPQQQAFRRPSSPAHAGRNPAVAGGGSVADSRGETQRAEAARFTPCAQCFRSSSRATTPLAPGPQPAEVLPRAYRAPNSRATSDRKLRTPGAAVVCASRNPQIALTMKAATRSRRRNSMTPTVTVNRKKSETLILISRSISLCRNSRASADR